MIYDFKHASVFCKTSKKSSKSRLGEKSKIWYICIFCDTSASDIRIMATENPTVAEEELLT